MQIGLFPNKDADSSAESSRLQRFAALLETGNTKFQIVPNIQVQRWEKVVWNAAWNPLTTISLLDTHAWLNSSELATPMTKRVMQEVINVAHALEVPVADDLIDRLFARILGMPPIGSSMRADFEAGKLMEVDIILGYPVRKGRELGVDVTTIETLYTLLKAVNKRLAG
jgi:2-dehydropantoate 2-reductase